MSQADRFAEFPQVTPKPGVQRAAGGFQFEYLRAYNYVFENPNWIMTILWWSLCILVAGFLPILPYLVLIGHFFEIVISLHQTQGKRYPDFDLNRFGEYIGRSVWPFLVGLIVFIPLFILLYVGIFLVVLLAAAGAAAGGDNFGPVLAVLVGFLGFVVLFAFMAAIGMAVTPFILRAGLQGDFASAFDFGWAMDFVKKTWLESILATLFIQLSGMVLMFIGLLALCIGLYPANALMLLAQCYMMYQLYELFLSRGGAPIPIKPPAPYVIANSGTPTPTSGFQPPM